MFSSATNTYFYLNHRKRLQRYYKKIIYANIFAKKYVI